MRGGSGGLRYYHRNQQYSITALTDGGGSIVERYAYTAYGHVAIFDSNLSLLAASAEGNRYTYTGREWDEGLDLYHYRARMYDAVAGRFVSRDPIGFRGGISRYRANFVINHTDPLGLKCGDNRASVGGLNECISPKDVGKRRANVSDIIVSPGSLNPDETEDAVNWSIALLLVSMLPDIDSAEELTIEMMQMLVHESSVIADKMQLIIELKKLQQRLMNLHGNKSSIWVRFACEECKNCGPFWNTRRQWVPEGEKLVMCNISETEWAENHSQRPGSLPIIGDSEVFLGTLRPQERQQLLDDCECQAIESCKKSGHPFSPNW